MCHLLRVDLYWPILQENLLYIVFKVVGYKCGVVK